MSRLLRALIVEDSEDDALLLVRELRKAGHEVAFERVDNAEAMDAALEDQKDIIIADYVIPGFSGLAALQLMQRKGLDLPFIIVSGKIGEETAVQAMKMGAHDFVLKGNLARLVPAIERELREAEVRRERRRAEEALREAEEQQKQFYKQTILAATGGKLAICDDGEVASLDGIPIGKFPLHKPEDAGIVRHRIKSAAVALGMTESRADNFVLAIGEAATNALKHAGGGEVSVIARDNRILARISDHGSGMDALVLPRVTLELGYSTGGTLGMGYAVILSFADRILLSTGPSGTTVVIEMDIGVTDTGAEAEALPDTW